MLFLPDDFLESLLSMWLSDVSLSLLQGFERNTPVEQLVERLHRRRCLCATRWLLSVGLFLVLQLLCCPLA